VSSILLSEVNDVSEERTDSMSKDKVSKHVEKQQYSASRGKTLVIYQFLRRHLPQMLLHSHQRGRTSPLITVITLRPLHQTEAPLAVPSASLYAVTCRRDSFLHTSLHAS
jgi:hypothetical protein